MHVTLGNHLKIHVDKSLREKTREFYLSILKCKSIPTPIPGIERFKFEGDVVIGVAFLEESELLSEKEQLKGTWLELKTQHPEQLKKELMDFGVKEIAYEDKTHFYFQAPGGQVFRIASLDEGL